MPARAGPDAGSRTGPEHVTELQRQLSGRVVGAVRIDPGIIEMDALGNQADYVLVQLGVPVFRRIRFTDDGGRLVGLVGDAGRPHKQILPLLRSEGAYRLLGACEPFAPGSRDLSGPHRQGGRRAPALDGAVPRSREPHRARCFFVSGKDIPVVRPAGRPGRFPFRVQLLEVGRQRSEPMEWISKPSDVALHFPRYTETHRTDGGIDAVHSIPIM
ncbi:hypothetical protein [Streptomyces sp. TRM75561]|uniref:hypothetical protein n=1 Tax=Streptomyces sp. TRM75561 TaxID=2975269 RepID=UPI002448B28F|nr:hypothetical protein [Streptomyces sp. TRM75561]MDH3039214.1 hypothetical protein [Streptomyces sp. TRM75561]